MPDESMENDDFNCPNCPHGTLGVGQELCDECQKKDWNNGY